MTIVVDTDGVELTREDKIVYRGASLDDVRQYADDLVKFDRMVAEIQTKTWGG